MRSLRCFDTHGGHLYGYEAAQATERGEQNYMILYARAAARSVGHPINVAASIRIHGDISCNLCIHVAHAVSAFMSNRRAGGAA